MNSKNQAGFSIVEGVIAVVVIAVLGFMGWTAYNSFSQPSKKTASTTTGSQTSNTPTKVTDTAATVTTQGTYLDIKEFGIKILLNSSINDAVYATYNTPSTDGSKIVGLSAQSLIKQDQQTESKVYCTAANGAIGIIIETTNPIVATPAGNQTLTPDGKNVFKFGNTYYRYVRPQNEGCGVNQATDDMENAKVNAFQQAFTTLQSDN